MFRRGIIPVLSILVAIAAIAYALFEQSWVPAYWEAEPLHRVALQFGRSLAERLANEHREAIQWNDVTTLLADDRFASLRDRGFVPSSQPDILITIRLNDRFDAPIRKDGFVLLHRR
jgi:hypothetical protein